MDQVAGTREQWRRMSGGAPDLFLVFNQDEICHIPALSRCRKHASIPTPVMVNRATSIFYGLVASAVFFARKSPAAQTFDYKGRRYISLGSVGTNYGMSHTAGSSRQTYKNRWNTLEFEHDSRKCYINGVTVWLLHPVRNVMGSWAIYERDYRLSVAPVLESAKFLRKVPTTLVMLDPGHGGKDDGAVGRRNVKERLVVMDVAKRVERELKKHGIRVRKTRSSDTYVGLSERAAIAARAGASLFVSIHINSGGESVSGSETYVLAPTGEDSTNYYGQQATKTACRGNRHDAANMVLGYRIQRALLKSAGRPDRGVKRARFKVLKDAPCPAALVEGAFVSNPTEEAKMIDASFREAMAQGIATGIREYLSLAQKAR